MEMIVNEERKDMDPVTIGMMIPVFVKRNEDSLNVSEDMAFFLTMQLLGIRNQILIAPILFFPSTFTCQ